MFHHGHPSDPGQDYRLAIHFYGVGAVVGPESLLVLSPLEASETRRDGRDVSLPSVTLPVLTPPWQAAWPRSMMAYLAAFWDNSRHSRGQ